MSTVSWCIAIRQGSARLIRPCRVAMRCGKDCGCTNGRIFKLHEHLDRLEHSARALSFVEIPPHEKIIDEIKRTLAANRMSDGVHIRLTLTRGVKITSGMDPRLNQSRGDVDRSSGA